MPCTWPSVAEAIRPAITRRRSRRAPRLSPSSVHSRWRGGGLGVPALAFHRREVEREREREAGEEAGQEEQPRAPNAAPEAVDDGKDRHQNDIGDHVVLIARAASGGGELSLDEFRIAGRAG